MKNSEAALAKFLMRLPWPVIAIKSSNISIELLQLITGFMAKTTFRIADMNDVIFNTVGVAIGYLLFVEFMRIYRHISHKWEISANPILRYIAK